MLRRISLKIKRLFARMDGPTTVEYAVLLALIVGMAFVSITFFGDEMKALSDLIETTLSGALSDGK